uniref:Uncharacterized protein n=1 Tax=Brassica oleracea var. oleracea TaxID=109376 RepID=A0A0D3AMF6_BRAOL
MRSSLMVEKDARIEVEREERDDLEETQNEPDDFNSIPPWKSQITFRGIVASLIIGIIYNLIVMKLNLTTGLIPTLNVSAALSAFVLLRSWTKLLTKAGIMTKPFTKQENTVVQTCAVACYSVTIGGGFGSYLLSLNTRTYEQSGVHTEGNSPGSTKEPGIGWMTCFLFFTCFVGLVPTFLKGTSAKRPTKQLLSNTNAESAAETFRVGIKPVIKQEETLFSIYRRKNMRSSLMVEKDARIEVEREERDDLEETQNEPDDFNSIPPWKSQITFRGIVASLIIGIIYNLIVMKLNLTTGLIPTLNVSAALSAFVLLRSWTKLLTKAGIMTKPFTKQENTVVQTCAVACYSVTIGGGFGSYLLSLNTRTYEQSGVHTEGNSPGSTKEPGIGWMTCFLFFTCFVGLLALVPLRKVGT